MKRSEISPPCTYQIRLKETLDRSAFEWFEDLAITPQENGGTLLIGQFADQPALRGFIDQLWNLNLTLESVIRITKDQSG